MRSFILFLPLALALFAFAHLALSTEAPTKRGNGMAAIKRPDVGVLYSADLKLGTGPADGEIVICLYSPKARMMVCMSPEEFDARSDDFGVR